MTLPASDGLPAIVLRRITPADKDGLVAGLGRLSERSVYQRFLSPKPRLSSGELRYLTEVDFTDHYALVAVLEQAPGVIVAVGRWVRSAEDPAGPRSPSSSPTTCRAAAWGPRWGGSWPTRPARGG